LLLSSKDGKTVVDKDVSHFVEGVVIPIFQLLLNTAGYIDYVAFGKDNEKVRLFYTIKVLTANTETTGTVFDVGQTEIRSGTITSANGKFFRCGI
jgi:hypothetical protein